MERKDWVWMPHAAHLIVGNDCRFHLATYVGGYIVSTVGEYLPDERTWDTYAEQKGVILRGRGDARKFDFLERVGYIEIGLDRIYETMVFRARPSPYECCPWTAADWGEVDFAGYNDAAAATKGHMEMCEKWAQLPRIGGGLEEPREEKRS